MHKFILLTFALLGLAFYQMSGGSDFQPPARPVIVEAAVEPAAAPVEIAPVTTVSSTVSLSATLPQVDASEPEADTDDATLPPRQITATIRETVQDVQDLAARTPDAEPAIQADTTEFSSVDPDQTLIVPSLITDIRSVTGNSVNMRAGPGTDFEIVDRLTRGAEVEVLQDPGTGWLELRAVESGITGWMADWLVSAG